MKNTIKLFLLYFISLNNLTHAQISSCQWAQSAGGYDGDLGNSITTDASGNVFISGSFTSQTIAFGTTTLTNTNNNGLNGDIFIVKYSSSGTVLWASSAAGQFDDEILGVSTDASGNVFVTGHFNSPTLTFGTTTLTNAYGSADLFIAKYSPSGTVLWASSVGGTGINADIGYGVATDASGNAFVTGGFGSPSIAFGTTTLTNAGGGNGYTDIFIAKYSPSGTVLWASSAGGTDIDEGLSVSTDPSGNVFVTGGFRSHIVALGTTTLTNISAGNNDMFIVKYSSSGTVLWASSAHGTYGGRGTSTDAAGNVMVTGYFDSPTLAFGTTTLILAGGGFSNADIFIVKYSPSGTVLWANSAGGSFYDAGYGLSTDASGNVFVTGGFRSLSIAFGTTTLTNADTSGGHEDIFIAKYSPTGTVLWASSAGGLSYDSSYGVSADASGNVFVTGGFSSPTMAFGTTTLTNADNGGNFPDIFIAKLCVALVSINENQKEEVGINIYPNPFISKITITFPKEQTSGTIKITDVLGKDLQVISHFQGRQVIIDRGMMEAGIYLFQVMDEKNNMIIRKIVLQ